MCKGIAILINDRDIKMNEKESSHSALGNEDKYLKVNVIYDDREKRGYRFEVDNHGNDQLMNYQKQGYVTKAGKIIASYRKRLEKFCKDNEYKFFRLFCRLLQNATIKGYQYNRSATIEGDQNNTSAKIEGDQYNDSVRIVGYQYNDYAKIKGNQHNNSAKIKGYQSNNSARIVGNQSNDFATIKGNQSNTSATIKGDIILLNTIIKDKDSETSKLIKEFSNGCDGWKEATLTNFVKWLRAKR